MHFPNIAMFSFGPKPRLILHATRKGTFEIYLAKNREPLCKLTSHASMASFLAWIDENHTQKELASTLWRVLADASDPISTCINLPSLNRQDRQAFIAQRLQTHQPEAPWRYVERTQTALLKNKLAHKSHQHPTTEPVLLMALPDAHLADHRLFPIIDALKGRGHCVESLVTPGLLLAKQQSDPTKIELLMSESPEGRLATLCVFGQYRFSRLLSKDIEPATTLSHLLPTLLTHHLLTRSQSQEVETRLLADSVYPQGLLGHLGSSSLAEIPSPFCTSNWQLSRLFAIRHRPLVVSIGLALGLVGLTYGDFGKGLNHTEERQIHAQTQAKIQHVRKDYRHETHCPSLFGTLQKVSLSLNRQSEITLQSLRWECPPSLHPAHITLHIETSESATVPYVAVKVFLEKLAILGQASTKPGRDERSFFVQIPLTMATQELNPNSAANGNDNGEKRGLFTPATPEQFQQWLTDWIKAYIARHPEVKASARVEDLSSTANQGTLLLSITSISEPPALKALDAFIRSVPALIYATSCEWHLEPERPSLKTLCQLHWQRFPGEETNQAGDISDGLPPIHTFFSEFQHENEHILSLGTLFWTEAARKKMSMPKAPTRSSSTSSDQALHEQLTTSPTNQSRLQSYGWIQRSDGMTLRWSAP